MRTARGRGGGGAESQACLRSPAWAGPPPRSHLDSRATPFINQMSPSHATGRRLPPSVVPPRRPAWEAFCSVREWSACTRTSQNRMSGPWQAAQCSARHNWYLLKSAVFLHIFRVLQEPKHWSPQLLNQTRQPGHRAAPSWDLAWRTRGLTLWPPTTLIIHVARQPKLPSWVFGNRRE